MLPNNIDQFRQDMLDAGFKQEMLDAGFEVMEYRASSGYKGPAVIVKCKADIQDIIRATSVRVDWHPWTQLSYVVWPV